MGGGPILTPKWPSWSRITEPQIKSTFSLWVSALIFCDFLWFSLESFGEVFLCGKIKEYGKGNSVGLRLLSIDLAIGHLKSFLDCLFSEYQWEKDKRDE